MFVQLHFQGLVRTALILSAVGAAMLALSAAGAPGAI
jgi:hypothetical protein